ncbi:uncharacterized protein LOC120808306 isoform X1 [Gasterosteus aculeatus]
MLWKSLEGACKDLVDEMQKRTPNGPLVKQKMDQMFVLRRKEVVESEPAISTMVRRWPALFTQDQVFMECSRIVGKNLKTEFYDSIDRHSPRLLELFGSKRGNVGQTNESMMILFVTQTLGYFLLSVKVLCSHLPSISVQPR